MPARRVDWSTLMAEPELYGDEHEPIEEDTIEQMIDGEHPEENV